MTSKIFIVPGLGNSGEAHWQTLWENQFNFTRIQQSDWETPVRTDWVDTLDKAITQHDPASVILVGHSLACATIAFWSNQYKRKIRGALLVGPSHTEADTYPQGTAGFTPIPLVPLSFPSIVVASTNDYYVRFERAQQFAKAWGSKLVSIGDAGHINVAAGFGAWEQGLEFLKELDRQEL